MSNINFDTASELFITCRKGDSFEMELTDVQIDGVDITSSYNASMIVRPREGATAGSLVGIVGSRLILGQATTAAAGGLPPVVEFKFGDNQESQPLVLRGTSQGVGIVFGSAPATTVTLNVEIEFTEES